MLLIGSPLTAAEEPPEASQNDESKLIDDGMNKYRRELKPVIAEFLDDFRENRFRDIEEMIHPDLGVVAEGDIVDRDGFREGFKGRERMKPQTVEVYDEGFLTYVNTFAEHHFYFIQARVDYGEVIVPAIELKRGDADPDTRDWYQAADPDHPRRNEALMQRLRIFLWVVFERYQGDWHLAQIELTKQAEPDFTPIGLILPEFTLTKATTEQKFRQKHWRGRRAMVLNFWHENTHALKEQLEMIQYLTYEKYKDEPVYIWNVTLPLSRRDSMRGIRRPARWNPVTDILDTMGFSDLNGKVLLDDNGYFLGAEPFIHVNTTPYMVCVDETGMVTAVLSGFERDDKGRERRWEIFQRRIDMTIDELKERQRQKEAAKAAAE
jgi:hypothetical protein